MLKNKNIVITGCNRGIGMAIMKACAESGANIIACMRKEAEDTVRAMQELSLAYNVEIIPFYCDMSDEAAIKEAAAQILKLKHPIDGMVNNTGITGDNLSFPMTSMNKIREIFQINLFGPMYFTQRMLKNMMRNRKGSIVNIASMAAIDGEPAQMGYVSSKAAVIGETKKLASEMGKVGIRANAIAPGVTDTGMLQQMDEALLEKTLGRTALGRVARPEEIANVAVFLLSDRSSYITGQTIRVDGGVI